MRAKVKNKPKLRVRAVVTRADGTKEDYGTIVDQINPIRGRLNKWYHRFKIQASRILRSR